MDITATHCGVLTTLVRGDKCILFCSPVGDFQCIIYLYWQILEFEPPPVIPLNIKTGLSILQVINETVNALQGGFSLFQHYLDPWVICYMRSM